MDSRSALPTVGVDIVTNLEARLRIETPRCVQQLDGEVRYKVSRSSKPFVVKVRSAVLRVEHGVVSVRIEAERVFVSVADGGVWVSESGLTDVLVAGDLLRLPRLKVSATRSGPPRPPPLPPRLTRRNKALPPTPPPVRPIEIPRVDSGMLTMRRRAPSR